MTGTEGEQPEKKTAAKKTAAKKAGDGSGPVSLADAAGAALSSVPDDDGAAQETLDGTDYTKVKFVGMSFDSLGKEDAPRIGDEMTFLVRARCVASGDEASKRDGGIRHVVKMDVQSVVVSE